MADRYWVGGSGTWDDTDTTNWSTSSGGSGGASAPTTTDNVFFDSNSGTGTVSVVSSPACKNLVTTGISSSLIIGDIDGTILPHEPTAITFDANTTFGAAIGFVIYNNTTAGNACTLTTNGVALTGSINLLIGSTSGTDTFDLADDLTLTTLTIQAIFGTCNVRTNNYSITCKGVQAITAASGSPVVDFGTSTVTVTGISTVQGPYITINAYSAGEVDLASATFIVDPVLGTTDGTGTIIQYTNADIGTIQIAKHQYPIVINNINVVSPDTIGTFTFTQLDDYTVPIFLGEDVEITTLNLTSYSAGRRIAVLAQLFGEPITSARTLTCATANLTNVDFYGITAAGAAAPFSATGDWGLNTSINFTSSVTRYAVSVGGDWSDTATWATSSGGSSGASVPLPQDTAVFDANSSGTYSFDTIVAGEIDASAFTGQFDFDGYSSSSALRVIYFCGDFDISATTVIGDMTALTPTSYCFFIGDGSHTFSTSGVIFKVDQVQFYNGTFTLGSNFNMLTDPTANLGATLVVQNGTLDFNDYDVTVGKLTAISQVNKTIYLRSGTLTLDDSGTVLNLADGTTYIDFEAGTSTILINNSSTAAKTVSLLNSNIINKLVIGGGASTSQVTISNGGVVVIKSLTSTRTAGGYTLTFSSGGTYGVGRWTIYGKSGSLVTVRSTSSGSAFNLTDIAGGGLKTSNFVDLKDSNAVGADLWYAGAQSVDSGNNGAWIFETYGGGAMLLFFR